MKKYFCFTCCKEFETDFDMPVYKDTNTCMCPKCFEDECITKINSEDEKETIEVHLIDFKYLEFN